MTELDEVTLHARRVRYYSELDERGFFEWLKQIPSVRHFEGRGDTLYIHVSGKSVDEIALRELLALFHRYGIDLSQLVVFDQPDADWFHDKRAFWHTAVFGPA